MYESRLREALPRVRDAIQEAAARAGRDSSDVTLVTVTKGHPPAAAAAAMQAGLRDLGENRVEELEQKVEALGRSSARWHMIGHLQSRKARRIPGLCDLLHSLDSLHLAEKLARALEVQDRTLPVLIQLNTSGEEAKSGFPADEAPEVVHRILEMPRLRVEGLMTMAPFTEDEAVLRATFAGLRAAHEAAQALPGYQGRELSMGMTNDYTIAIEEGSTMIRLGTALLGERPK